MHRLMHKAMLLEAVQLAVVGEHQALACGHLALVSHLLLMLALALRVMLP
jgi:hypothetical protein